MLLSVLRCQLTYQGQVVTNAEARFSKSLRPRKAESSLGWTAQDVHLDSHTAPELCRDAAGQRTGFNTLDNWGHKTPTQSKRKRTGKKRLKGHGPEHVYNTLGYIHPPPTQS